MQKTMQGLKRIQEQQAREKKATELRDMLQTLLEAGEYANGLAVAGDTGALQELFAGMQEIAIAVGQEVDRVFGENTQTVTLLEEYCEVVWQCSQAQDTGLLCKGLQQAVGLIQQVLQLNFQ